jgi:hypothetical protein
MAAARALRCLRRGSGKLASGGGNNSLRRLHDEHDEEDFRHRCGRHIADKRRDRCAGAIQSKSDGGHRHGGEPRTDPVRSLYPWVSRVCVLAALAPPMALVSPALVICRNGLQRRYRNQLISVAYDRFGSFASEQHASDALGMSASLRSRHSPPAAKRRALTSLRPAAASTARQRTSSPGASSPRR